MNTSNLNLNEKVSVNINSSTLASIDMLVDNGYYSNRSDFINQALREALQRNEPNIARCAQAAGNQLRQGQWFMGVMVVTPQDVADLLSRGKAVTISGYGVLCISQEVEPEQLFAAVSSIQVRGRVVCGEAIKEHYRLK